MLNIYFTASTAEQNKFLQQNKKIISLIKKNRGHLTSGMQIVDKSLLSLDEKIEQSVIFNRQKSLIDQSDCLIAEVTNASLGVGGEIVYALTKNIPVLALILENHEEAISPMIVGNPSDNFFLEHYNDDKLPYLIKDFFKHINTIKKRRGVFIVIDGGDGSGKTTQSKLLIEHLKKSKIPAKLVDFPQYYNSFHGKTVAKFLRGEFGSIDQVSPYLASLAYALDRASVKTEMEDFLEKGGYIIANRYATSNMAHQGAKFTLDKEKNDFLKWVYDLEYKVHRIPKENLVIYLYVPWQISTKLTDNRTKKGYLQGQTKDIHEKDLNHLRQTEQMYLMLAKKFPHWVKINCTSNGKILSRETIHKLILSELKKRQLI